MSPTNAALIAAGLFSANTVLVPPRLPLPSQHWIAQASDTHIPVVLPALSDIQLKNGDSISGKVSAITSQGVTVSLGGNSASIPIADIQKVVFRNDAPTQGGELSLSLRGGKAPTSGSEKVFQGVPVDALQVKDTASGRAEVEMGTVLDKSALRSIKAVTATSPLVVQEIVFSSPAAMTIKARPVARR